MLDNGLVVGILESKRSGFEFWPNLFDTLSKGTCMTKWLCWTSFSFGVSKGADDLLHTVLCVLLDVALEEVIWKLQEWMMRSDFSWKRWCQQNFVLVSQDRWAISSPFSRSWWMITVYLFIFLVYFVHSLAVIETSFPKLLFCHSDPFCSGNDGLLS